MEESSDRLARIETKLDTLLQAQLDHETRVRSIERWMYSIPATLFVALGSAATAITSLLIGK